jgi:hypothetical protein
MAARLVQQDVQQYHLYTSGDHAMYAIPAEKLMSLADEGTLKVWSGNRPADMARVEEVRKEQAESHHVDGTIRVAYIVNVGLVCYEGNHRRLALNPEISRVLVDILWNVSNDRVVHEFMLVNKAVSVPELYTEVDVDATEKNKITKFVADWCVKYKAFVSTSARPNRPQFNRDTFTQELTRLWKKFECPADTLLSAVERLNSAYANELLGDRNKIKSENILKKCKVGGLWLFAFDTTLSAKDVEAMMV